MTKNLPHIPSVSRNPEVPLVHTVLNDLFEEPDDVLEPINDDMILEPIDDDADILEPIDQEVPHDCKR